MLLPEDDELELELELELDEELDEELELLDDELELELFFLSASTSMSDSASIWARPYSASPDSLR